MANDQQRTGRRNVLKALGTLGAAGALGGTAPSLAGGAPALPAGSGFREELARLVAETPMVDTHEHLPEEDERLGGKTACDDWGLLMGHYLGSELVVAGMPGKDLAKLTARGVDPLVKWRLVAPYWPAVKNTGYGQAVRIAMSELYGVEELNDKTVPRLQPAYEAIRKPGFYRKILVDMGRIESCQVNGLGGRPFTESRQPTLLMQDLSIWRMHVAPEIEPFARPAGKTVRDLSDWHAVIRWWFDKYGPYAVAVKTQAAYMRGLDFDRVPPEKAAPVFRKWLNKDQVSPQEQKLMEDHLFWYTVDEATRHHLPIKLHTGIYAGHSGMPLARVAGNPAEACELCRKAQEPQFVFMHIAYPYWQDLIAVAKHFINAHIDMCWAWILDPVTATQFLKTYLVAAPANKLLPFGGDAGTPECALGHSRMARRGIAMALGQLVEDGWLRQGDALELVELLLRGNAHRIFHLEEKLARLRKAPWM